MESKKKHMPVLAIVLILALAIGAACAIAHFVCSAQDTPAAGDEDSGQIPSPFVTCETMEEAAKLTGFELTLPQEADTLEVLDGEVIQASCSGNSGEFCVRKAAGGDDISGDYSEYADVETADGVTLKGADGKFSLALWTDGGYTYSVSVGEALSQEELLELVSGVK